MKNKLRSAVTALFILLGGQAAYAWSSEEMNRTIDETNFVVNIGCSGTLIDVSQRLVLTANHCVTGQYKVVEREVIDPDGTVKTKKVRELEEGTVSQRAFRDARPVKTTEYSTKLLFVDRDKDLALLQILAEIPNKTQAILSCTNPARGDAITIVGNPMGVLYSSVTAGIVSSVQRTYGTLGASSNQDTMLMQVSGGLVGGNSGGAVYNTDGRLIGVPVLGHRINEVLGFAVSLSDIKAFLKSNGKEEVYRYCDAP